MKHVQGHVTSCSFSNSATQIDKRFGRMFARRAIILLVTSGTCQKALSWVNTIAGTCHSDDLWRRSASTCSAFVTKPLCCSAEGTYLHYVKHSPLKALSGRTCTFGWLGVGLGDHERHVVRRSVSYHKATHAPLGGSGSAPTSSMDRLPTLQDCALAHQESWWRLKP
jgi:hypothetical protein